MNPVDAHGLVTIMHVDVEGSTALATRAGDEAAQKVLTETKRIVRERAHELGGREIDAVGDAMMMTFTSTRAAIAGATAVQEELAARERKRPDETLRVRIGLNVGEVLERDGTPFGAAVNAGARVMAKADGGEILVSEMVRQLAGTVPGIQYRDRGRHTFKGFDEPWRLYEVVWPGAPPRRAKPRARPSRRGVLAVGALLVMVTAVLAFVATRGSSRGLSRVEPNNIGVIDPNNDRIVDEVPVGIRPGPIVVDKNTGSVWVGNLDDRFLTRIDSRRRIASEVSLNGRTPTALAVGAGAVWVAHGARGELSRVDPEFNRLSKTIPVSSPTASQRAGVAFGAGAVWAAYGDSTLARVDPDNVRVTGHSFAGGAPAGVVLGGGSIWVANSGDSSVDRFNPATFQAGPLKSISVGNLPEGIAYGAGAVWVACEGDDVVTRIEPATGATTTIPVGDGPTAVAVGAGAVWVANSADGTVSRIDVGTNNVVRTIDVGGAPAGIAVGGGFVWVAVEAP